MSEASPSRVEVVADRLARSQSQKPWLWLAISFAIGALALPWVLALDLNSDFQAMLPESAPSVRDLDEIRQRFGGTSTLTLAVQVEEGGSIEHAREFVRALVPRIEAMHDHQVTTVDWNVHDFETFVEDHRFLYASLADLNEMRQSLSDRLEYEHARANPFYIDLDDEPPPDPEAVIHRMEEDAREARAQMDRFPEGFYQHPSRPILLVFIRTAIRGGEAESTDSLIAAVEDAADAVTGEHARERRGVEGAVGYAVPGMRIDFGGDLMDVREETEALKEAVERSTIVTAVLLCAVIYLFYLRKRAIPLLALVLVPPVLVTFGLAEVFVDYLNASTAFLGSIVVGNGVNASVIWLGRYFEERREGQGVERAIAITHRGTWSATMAASFAAALSYGSLIVTDYRGFRDFGIIGGIGMVLCWVATYTVLPSLATVSERLRPLVFSEREKRMKGVYGVLSARLALGAPRVVLALSVAIGLVFVVALAHRLSGSVLEYDFRQLQADRSAESRVHMVSELVGDTVEETRSGSALAILAPRVEDVAPLRAQLDAYAAEHPGRIGPVRSVADLLPADQDEKIPVLAELRRLLLEVRPHLSEERQQQIDENTPPEAVTPVGLADLPESVARPFTERDGTRGRLLFVEHAPSESTWDGRYLIRWAEAARTAHTADGRAPAIAGAAVVFADLLTAIYADGVKAIGVSLLSVALLVFFSFRRNRERGLTMGALLLGVVWMAGALAVIGARLNFLNLVAFPITFGIGVDYSVNVIQRYVEETERDARGALQRSLEGAGGAVILCSLTTIIGYISLFASTNRAINSFGLAMTLSEITCLTTAVIVLPAMMQWSADRAAARVASTSGTKPSDA